MGTRGKRAVAVQIIMDGNSRFAEERGLAASDGHRAGVRALRQTVDCCLAWHIPALTLFAFSTENWARPAPEVQFIMRLMESCIENELTKAIGEGVRVDFVGELDLLPTFLRGVMARAEERSRANYRLRLTMAVSYSARRDITLVMRQTAERVAARELMPSEVTEELLDASLALGRLPKELRSPDLLIRTSGERRLSNFLLWELAFAELHFCDRHWPEFGQAEFRAALADFASRNRRFGARSSHKP